MRNPFHRHRWTVKHSPVALYALAPETPHWLDTIEVCRCGQERTTVQRWEWM